MSKKITSFREKYPWTRDSIQHGKLSFCSFFVVVKGGVAKKVSNEKKRGPKGGCLVGDEISYPVVRGLFRNL